MIILAPFTPADRDAAVALLMDEKIKQTYMVPDFENEAQAEKLFLRLMALSMDAQRFVRGIYADGALVGFLNDVEMVNGTIELGYVVSSACWGRGYATRGLKIAISQLFARGFREVVCGAFLENPASLRVMEKCGMALLPKTDEIEYRGKTHLCRYRSIKKLTLVAPQVEDLWFKRDMLSDGETMSYNAWFGGCIAFPEEKWESWHQKWLGREDPHYFYRYLRSEELGEYVGEIAYRYAENRWLCDVIILAKHRGRGFGKLGLTMLCEAAKENGIDALSDELLPENPALKLFFDMGFTEVSRNDETLLIQKIL